MLGMDHYGIFTEDLARAIDFYVEIRGFEKLFVTDDRANSGLYIGVVQKGDLKLELLQSVEAVQATASAQASMNHLPIACKNIGGIYNERSGRGIVFVTAPVAGKPNLHAGILPRNVIYCLHTENPDAKEISPCFYRRNN